MSRESDGRSERLLHWHTPRCHTLEIIAVCLSRSGNVNFCSRLKVQSDKDCERQEQGRGVRTFELADLKG